MADVRCHLAICPIFLEVRGRFCMYFGEIIWERGGRKNEILQRKCSDIKMVWQLINTC